MFSEAGQEKLVFSFGITAGCKHFQEEYLQSVWSATLLMPEGHCTSVHFVTESLAAFPYILHFFSEDLAWLGNCSTPLTVFAWHGWIREDPFTKAALSMFLMKTALVLSCSWLASAWHHAPGVTNLRMLHKYSQCIGTIYSDAQLITEMGFKNLLML